MAQSWSNMGRKPTVVKITVAASTALGGITVDLAAAVVGAIAARLEG